MNKSIKIFLLILGILIIFLILGQANLLQNVSTDKKTYSVGEEIKISIFISKPFSCTCQGPSLKYYIELDDKWVEINNKFSSKGWAYCVDGEIKYEAWCDVVMCSFNPRGLFLMYTTTWQPTTLVENNESCTQEGYTQPLPSFSSIPAQPGNYKITYGNSATTFSII